MFYEPRKSRTARFLERETGGYRSSVAGEGGPAIREIQSYVSPAAVTINACAEQTFTIPGLLANERIAYVTQLSPSTAGNFISSTCNVSIGGWHVNAISVLGIAYCAAGTSAGTITTGTSNGVLLAIGVAQGRGL
jgi:hypothetical protein